LGVGFVAAVDLRLEVFDGAVDGADGAGFGGAACFESFELVLEL